MDQKNVSREFYTPKQFQDFLKRYNISDFYRSQSAKEIEIDLWKEDDEIAGELIIRV